MNNQDSHCRCGTDGEQVIWPIALSKRVCALTGELR